jgi:methionine synthase II (cobalamin-independent)
MKRSTERILTTHAGSLARPPDLLEMMRLKEADQPYDQAAFAGRVRSAVAEVVRQQVRGAWRGWCGGAPRRRERYRYLIDPHPNEKPRG